MTRLPGVPDSDDAKPGMAFFAGTGPDGCTCGTCRHRGYWRTASRTTLNKRTGKYEYRTYRHGGCAVYRTLMDGKPGPVVATDWNACKYFEKRQRGVS